MKFTTFFPHSKNAHSSLKMWFAMISIVFVFLPINLMFENQVVGNTNFSTSVNENGAANVSININIPKGTFVQPKLTLSYNSHTSNGPEGLGVSLSGVTQMISRIPATIAQDGYCGSVDITENDRLALNGERLMVVKGKYNSDLSEYKTEQNSFSRIIAYGSTEYGPEKFKMWTKDGLILEFGFTADSKIEAAGTSGKILVWLLNKVEDTNGNYYTVQYAVDNANGEFYPVELYYTGNSKMGLQPYNKIVLTYESRPDLIAKYVAGFRTISVRRLSSIASYDNNTLFRRYKLTYGNNPGYSKLTQVVEYGTDNSSYLNPVTLTWNSPTPANYHFNKTGSGNWSGHGGGISNNVPGDFNADGRTDLAGYAGNGSWHVSLSNGSGFTSSYWAGHGGGVSNNVVGDFNGDGRTDLAGYAGNGSWHVSLSKGNSFISSYWAGHGGGVSNNLTGDFNGDGRTDLAGYAGNGTWHVSLSTGSGFTSSFWNVGHTYGKSSCTIGDFNGDGKSDIAAYKGGKTSWLISISTGSNFVTTDWAGPWAGPNNAFVGDYNGDGLSDFASYDTNGSWAINFSTGKKFNQVFWLGHKGGYTNNIMGDFNGDGLSDLAGYGGNGSWHVTLSTGSGFNGSYMWQGQGGGAANNVSGDFNGDGLTDITGYTNTSGIWHVTLSNATKEFVTSVKNGNGLEYKFDYQSLVNAAVYAKGSGATYPALDFTGPLYVVKNYICPNGIGGYKTIDYFYGGARHDHYGRGFRGFSQTIRKDATANVRITTNYVTDYRCIAARVLSEEVHTYDGSKRLSKVENIITPVEQGNKVCFGYYSKITNKQYDLNSGVEISSLVKDFTYDTYGNPTLIKESYGDGLIKTTNNMYTNDETKWYLGRMSTGKVTEAATGKPTVIKNVSFEYDVSGNKSKDVMLPANSTLNVNTAYSRDNFGNIKSTTITGIGIDPQVTQYTYDGKGRHVTVETNALGHQLKNTYTNCLLTSITDADGLVTDFVHDAFGRIVRKNFPDGTFETMAYTNCSGNCPAEAVAFIETKASGSPTRKIYIDKLDRKVREETEGFDGRKIFVDTKYNADGTVNATSAPYFNNTSPVWTTYEYDGAKRKTKETLPGNRVTSIVYNGLSTKTINASGQNSNATVNMRGQLVSMTDHLGSAIQYNYDSQGNQTSLNYGTNRQITNSYDLMGHKIGMKDPDMGNFTYKVNALGLVYESINNLGERTFFNYDKLSRIVKRSEPEGVTEFKYDPVNAKGQLSQIWINNKLSESYEYNNKGKLVKITSVRNGQNKVFEYTYNSTGETETIKYPDGLVIKYVYNAIGYMTEVRNNTTNTLLLKATSYDQYGKMVTYTLGNGLISNKTFDPTTHELRAIQTGSNAIPISVQDLSITYNVLGNVSSREDKKLKLKENFSYDNLNRLTKVDLLRGNIAVTALTKTLQYDAYGNLIYKSDIGKYSYGENGATPNRLTSINTAEVTNCIYPLDQRLTFTSYNYASSIANASSEVRFTYGGKRDRQLMTVKKNGVVTLEKTYVGGLYEETKDNFGKLTTLCYITFGDETIAYISKSGSEPAKTTYIHADHLGSVNVLTNASGQIEQRYSFDAWGKQRNALTWDDSPELMAMPLFQRGYTFHESLDIDGLICMNARVYNPALGRFLSPDSFVQFPDDLQSLNRYAYVFNNPMTLIDPSGHFSWKKIGNFLKENVGTIVGIGIGLATGGLGSPLAAILSGASAGFGASFTQSLGNGSNFGDAFKSGLQGAAWGALSAGMTYGIAHGTDFFNPVRLSANKEWYVIKGIMHGIAQGGIAEARGGQFSQGFTSALFAELAIDAGDGLGLEGNTQIVVGTIVGGTTSELSGGKFANGALSGAFIAIYNHYECESAFCFFKRGIENTDPYKMKKDQFNEVINNSKPLSQISKDKNACVSYSAYGGKYGYSFGDFKVRITNGRPTGFYDYNNYNKGNRSFSAETATTIGRFFRGNNGYDIYYGDGLECKPKGN